MNHEKSTTVIKTIAIDAIWNLIHTYSIFRSHFDENIVQDLRVLRNLDFHSTSFQ